MPPPPAGPVSQGRPPSAAFPTVPDRVPTPHATRSLRAPPDVLEHVRSSGKLRPCARAPRSGSAWAWAGRTVRTGGPASGRSAGCRAIREARREPGSGPARTAASASCAPCGSRPEGGQLLEHLRHQVRRRLQAGSAPVAGTGRASSWTSSRTRWCAPRSAHGLVHRSGPWSRWQPVRRATPMTAPRCSSRPRIAVATSGSRSTAGSGFFFPAWIRTQPSLSRAAEHLRRPWHFRRRGTLGTFPCERRERRAAPAHVGAQTQG